MLRAWTGRRAGVGRLGTSPTIARWIKMENVSIPQAQMSMCRNATKMTVPLLRGKWITLTSRLQKLDHHIADGASDLGEALERSFQPPSG